MAITRASLLSPAGPGGMAVIQLAGPLVPEIAAACLRTRDGRMPPALDDHGLHLLRWIDGDETIDEVVATGGRTRSGQPALCVTPHGSMRVVERILDAARARGAVLEPIEAGELWPQLRPIEAAVLADLPRARTRRAACWLLEQIEALPQAVTRCCALLERGAADRAAALLADRAAALLADLAATYERARWSLDGACVAIAGPPNAGKSTLANRLFDRPFSLESPVAGTTRDWVERPAAIDGIPLTLTDTAGLRTACDPLERAAQAAARPRVAEADVQVLVLDSSDPDSVCDPAWFGGLLRPERLIVVLNKSDLGVMTMQALDASNASARVVRTSALLGSGLDALRAAIIAVLERGGPLTPVPALWQPRQLEAVRAAQAELPDGVLRAAAALRACFLP